MNTTPNNNSARLDTLRNKVNRTSEEESELQTLQSEAQGARSDSGKQPSDHTTEKVVSK